VLQHAFLTPNTSIGLASQSGQATYADLFLLAVRAVDEATQTSLGSLRDASVEVRGFEAFLVASSRHLQQVMPLAPPSSPARQIFRTLQGRQPVPVHSGTWSEATRAVALMSDLMATHHSSSGPITPEIQELYRTRRQDLALGRVFALILAGCLGGRNLTRQAAALRLRARRTAETEAVAPRYGRLNDLDRVIETVVNHSQSGLWQLERAAGATSQLDSLSTSTPHLSASVEPRSFPDASSAVQTLRRISFRQALGLESASPGSLNDLATLATMVTDPDADWLESRTATCATGLERVQLAHFRDLLAEAHHRWAEAPEGLTTSIQGLTKAPASLAVAVQKVGDHIEDPRIAAALIQALPQLGKDASTTLGRLGSTGSLVSAGREPGTLSIAWRPISSTQTRTLVTGFTTASKASVAPASTYREVETRTSEQRREQLAPDVLRARAVPSRQRTP